MEVICSKNCQNQLGRQRTELLPVGDSYQHGKCQPHSAGREEDNDNTVNHAKNERSAQMTFLLVLGKGSMDGELHCLPYSCQH